MSNADSEQSQHKVTNFKNLFKIQIEAKILNQLLEIEARKLEFMEKIKGAIMYKLNSMAFVGKADSMMSVEGEASFCSADLDEHLDNINLRYKETNNSLHLVEKKQILQGR